MRRRKTQKLKTWQNSKNLNVKIKKSKWEKKYKTQNVTNLKNLKCDKTKKLKILQNSTTEIKQNKKNKNVTKLKKNIVWQTLLDWFVKEEKNSKT